MMGYGAGLGLGFGFGGMLTVLGCVLLVVGLVMLVAWAVSRVGGTPAGAAAPVGQAPASPPAPDAMDVLRMRLARGEVTPEEFVSAKQALETGR